jgi:hypothetical protein
MLFTISISNIKLQQRMQNQLALDFFTGVFGHWRDRARFLTFTALS